MHNTHQSSRRAAHAERRRRCSNQVVWFTDLAPTLFDQTPEALEVLDEWLENIRANPRRVAGNKLARTDRCFDSLGREIAAGPNVWNGIIDDRPAGACTQRFRPSAPRAASRRAVRAEHLQVPADPWSRPWAGFYGSVAVGSGSGPPAQHLPAGGVRLQQADAGLPPEWM